MPVVWRGGLSERRIAPLGREAAPKPAIAVYQVHRMQCFTTATQPNGGKPPRHTSPPPHSVTELFRTSP